MDSTEHPLPSGAGRPEEASSAGGECPCVELSFPSCSDYLSLLRQTVEWFAGRCSFCEKDRARIVLSVVEATTNIIRHAYGGDPRQRIHLRILQTADSIELELLDSGQSTSPEAMVGKNPKDLEPGGLGVRMMKSCMDEFHYETRPEGGARLVLRKRLHNDGKPHDDRGDAGGKE